MATLGLHKNSKLRTASRREELGTGNLDATAAGRVERGAAQGIGPRWKKGLSIQAVGAHGEGVGHLFTSEVPRWLKLPGHGQGRAGGAMGEEELMRRTESKGDGALGRGGRQPWEGRGAEGSAGASGHGEGGAELLAFQALQP
jgi:hypothetical protein